MTDFLGPEDFFLSILLNLSEFLKIPSEFAFSPPFWFLEGIGENKIFLLQRLQKFHGSRGS